MFPVYNLRTYYRFLTPDSILQLYITYKAPEAQYRVRNKYIVLCTVQMSLQCVHCLNISNDRILYHTQQSNALRHFSILDTIIVIRSAGSKSFGT